LKRRPDDRIVSPSLVASCEGVGYRLMLRALMRIAQSAVRHIGSRIGFAYAWSSRRPARGYLFRVPVESSFVTRRESM